MEHQWKGVIFFLKFVAKIRHFAIRKQKVPSNMVIGNFGEKFPKNGQI
jgi:hypothetical protein